ncbi:MAG TPA: ABC transporter permease [Candidatus Acidoferrales bacterium]|nr:ABC transporter permease [Candidatus Acidoferrales bacterium]
MAMFREDHPLANLDSDIRDHISRETHDNIARGMSPADARFAALRKFGNVTQTKESTRGVWFSTWVEHLVQDARFSLRILRNSPSFAAVALLTLTIGVAANTAVFSVVNSILLRPLSYPNPEQLVALRQTAPGAAGLASFSEGLPLSASMYFTYAAENRSFQNLGIWITANANVTGLAEPEEVRIVLVSEGVLETLAVPPASGRWLSAVDQVANGPLAVILSYGYWQRHFGGKASAVGQTITVDSKPREIVGVMPRNFRVVNADFDLIVPLAIDRRSLRLAGFGFDAIARLKPGITIEQANADVSRMIPLWMDSWSNGPGTNPYAYERWKITPAIQPLKSAVVGSIGQVLWIVMATVGIVMLVVCANIANLFLVKAESRQRELAVRSALGAQRGRLVQQLILESSAFGLLGGISGIAFAAAGLRLLVAIGPANLPRLAEISLDARALVFAFAVSILAAVASGLAAAMKYTGARSAAAIRSEGRSSTASRARHRGRNILIAMQVAMALVLLVCAGLMIRTFAALRRVDPGFTHAEHLQLMRISIPPPLIQEPQRVLRTQNDIVDKLANIPGVISAAFGNEMPMEGFDSGWDEIQVDGKTYAGGENPPLYLYKLISPDYFRTTGTRIIAGRELSWTEVYERRPVGLVSENLARELWGSASAALGKRFREYSSSPWREVIGVVQDVYEDGVTQKAPAIVYWPTYGENLLGPGPVAALRSVTFAIRSNRAGTEDFLVDVRQAVWSVNSSLPLASVRTMQIVYERSLARTSFTLVMLALAGAVALILGIIGIYGVVSYTVRQRTNEIGIRMALGASPQSVLQLLLFESGKTAAIGIVVGLAACFLLTRLMANILFGVGALDPLTFTSVVLLLMSVALFACAVPARRASRLDPLAALRHE